MVTIQIENFQGHEKSQLTIDGFTVIVGSSNSGKSSIRRAINSILFNMWDKSYIKNGAKQTKITFSDKDNTIQQIKPKNSYTINGQEYPKVGKETPAEFTDMGIKMFDADGKKYNLIVGSQLDPLFMVTYSDQDNTRILNKIFNVEKYEMAAKEVKRDREQNKKEISFVKQLITEEKSRYAKLSDILQKVSQYEEKDSNIWAIEGFIQAVISKENKMNEIGEVVYLIDTTNKIKMKKTNIDDIDRYIGDVVKHQHKQMEKENVEDSIEKYKAYSSLAQNKRIIEEFVVKQNTYTKHKNQFGIVLEIIDTLESNKNNISKYMGIERYLSAKEKKQKILMKVDIANDILKLKKNITEKEEDISRLSRYIDRIKAKKEREILIKKIDQKYKEIKDMMPLICDKCGQPIIKDKK